MGWMSREPAEPELPSDLSGALSALRAKAPECPKPELLQAAQSDVLPAEQSESIHKHLAGCPTCKALLADLAAVDSSSLDQSAQARVWKKIQAGIAKEEPTVQPQQIGSRWWNVLLRPVPLAAMAAVVVVLAVTLVWIRKSPQPSEIAGNHLPTQLPTPKASSLQLEKAPIILPASAAIVWRGQADAAEKQAKDLKEALAAYESGDYADAVRRLERVRKRYPRIPETSFYLGVSQLFLNQDQDAARNLNEAAEIKGSLNADDAAWYLALAKHRLGKDDVARTILEKLCGAGGKNASRACAGAKELQSRP